MDGGLVGYRQQGNKLYELKDRKVSAQRRDIGMAFQRFNLFSHTAVENVVTPPPRKRGGFSLGPVDVATDQPGP
ncbi:hypothetical protein GCM10020221_23710 [Streptomyces thioluteus]|uniref:Uncharacterized protein n=1 Tax=Streptomyces thioluteus TaxID=66431 RepID=A0ABN3WVG2_STRTU